MKPGDLVMLALARYANLELYIGADPKKLSWLHTHVLTSEAVCLIVRVAPPNAWLIQVMTPDGRLGWQEARCFKKVV